MTQTLRSSIKGVLNRSIKGGLLKPAQFRGSTLDLDFAGAKSLKNQIGKKNVVSFTRASSGTYVGSDGLIQTATTDTPRFDYDPATNESLGLLIEESRTNLVTYSVPDATNWVDENMTVTINDSIAPDGTQTATKLDNPSGLGFNTSRIYNIPVSGGSNIARTGTVFAKAGTVNTLYMRGLENSGAVLIDLSTGQVISNGSGSAVTTEAYPNGWWKIALTVTSTEGIIYLATNTEVGYFYAWGAQIEEGSFPTSYIPTSGSTVTRAADVAEVTGADFAKTNLLEYS